MAVVRWNPWSDLSDLHAQMDQLFHVASPTTASRNGIDYSSLPVDIRQTDAAFFVEASVPGFSPEEVEVTFDDGVLTITGRRNSTESTKDGTYVRRERRATSVFRQVGLPAEVRAEDIKASFENGVLSIEIPRAQKAAPQRIPVTASKPERIIEHAQSA
jgi:HSP20 family protein